MILQIFAPLLANLGWCVLLVIILFTIKIFKPFLKGKIGEFAVSTHVKLYLNKDYIILNDSTLPEPKNKTTQIDHILLSPYGIFVIETKNYKGWIFGSERQKTWTQKIYKKSYPFQNPLYQNYKHQKVLQEILEDVIAPEFIHSVIVFMPDCVFKTPMPVNVFRGAGWTDYVKKFKDPVISPLTLKRIQLRIEKELLDKSWATNRKHVQNLKDKHAAQSSEL